MKTLRIRPGKGIQGKKALRTWYIIVLGYKPPGFKGRPYVFIKASYLDSVFNVLSEEYDKTFH